ncbi:MAG: 3-deoxy-D-manno-octulosonic acid transferase, partial [Opitutales bacterium]|nr:3-deoxy-D-manno-octulosonic acid transferase [Opitutales bacterium]
MIWLYRILFLPMLALSMPYYAMRMIRRGGYGRDFSHRLGFQKNLPPPAEGKTRIWIQAVSVGEVEALSSLLKMLQDDGKYEVVVTTTTSTGYKILREKYAKFCYWVGIFPFDFWLSSASAWRRIKPGMCVLMEGELWPEHLHRAISKKVPLLLLNARLSDKSFGRYSKAKYFAKRIFNKFCAIACGSDFDAARFLKLGAKPEIVSVTGNIKFDAAGGAKLSAEEKAALKKQFGFAQNSLVMLGSSTWQGEEEMLVEALKRIRQKPGIDARLLLVPRHAERRAQIREVLERGVLPFNFRTEKMQADE